MNFIKVSVELADGYTLYLDGTDITSQLVDGIFKTVGIFNAKKTNNPRRTESPDSDCGGYFDDTNYKLRGKERARFKEMLEDLLSAVPDTLTVDEVAELTGYHRRTILRYVQRKYIYAVNIMGKYYISKQSIINYLATDKAFKNTQKSEWHRNIVTEFSK